MSNFIFAHYDNTINIGNAHSGELPDLFNLHLDTNGDGTGNKNANGNYSAVETRFTRAPGAGKILRIHKLIVAIEDSLGFSTSKYGNIAALTAGIGVEITGDNRDTIDLLDGLQIKSNGDWAHNSFDVTLKEWGTGDELLVVRWDFGKFGAPIRLIGSSNDAFEVILNDNLTGLIGHHFMLQGHYE